MMTPALANAATDRRLSPVARSVLLWLSVTGTADIHEFRHVKLLTVQVGQRLSRTAAHRALQQLVACGYLDARPASYRNGREYRLAFALADASVRNGTVQRRAA